jgi:hypothetical protein
VSCVKKIKIGARNKTFHMIFCYLFTYTTKIFTFRKILRTHKDYEDVIAKQNFQNFLTI